MNFSESSHSSPTKVDSPGKKYAAFFLISLAVVVLLWLSFRACREGETEKWVKVSSGAYRFELVPAVVDSLAHAKLERAADDSNFLFIELNNAFYGASKLIAQAEGIPLQIRLADFPGKSFVGQLHSNLTVTKISPAQRDSVIHHIAKVKDIEHLLRPGMQVVSAVLIDTLWQAAYVADSAIFELNFEPVVFPRSIWPEPRHVIVGGRENDMIMIVDGIEAGEEVAALPPKNLGDVKRLEPATYQKALFAAREINLQDLIDKLNGRLGAGSFDSLKTTAHPEIPPARRPGVNPAVADSTAAIDRMLLEDSSREVVSGRVRIGPGEGGKLAPVSPETRQEMKPGEKITVSVPATSDSSGDTLQVGRRQTAKDTLRDDPKPPEEF